MPLIEFDLVIIVLIGIIYKEDVEREISNCMIVTERKKITNYKKIECLFLGKIVIKNTS